MSFSKLLFSIAAFCCIAATLVGCKGSPNIALPPPPAQRFFVTYFNPQTLSAYVLPLGPSSAPAATTTSGLAAPLGVVADGAGNLYVANGNSIAVYAPLVRAGSTPASVIGPIAGATVLEGMALDPSGNLWTSDAGANQLFRFTPPFPSGAVASPTTFTSASFNLTADVVFDASGNLYVPNFLVDTVTIFRPPFSFSGASVPAATITTFPQPAAVAIDHSGRLFVGSDSDDGRIQVFNPPFATGVAEAFHISSPPFGSGHLNFTIHMTFDASGNLYVSYQEHSPFGPGAVAVFAPPFTSASAPLFLITNGPANPEGMAFAP